MRLYICNTSLQYRIPEKYKNSNKLKVLQVYYYDFFICKTLSFTARTQPLAHGCILFLLMFWIFLVASNRKFVGLFIYVIDS